MALRHERMYGRGYQGPGSEKIFASLAARVNLGPGMRVLDVGSGLGGDSFRLAARYGVSVLGLDAAPDMTAICVERAREDGAEGVTLMTGDARTADLPAAPSTSSGPGTTGSTSRPATTALPAPALRDRFGDALRKG